MASEEKYWEWSDGTNWQKFDTASNTAIEAAFQNGQPSLSLKVGMVNGRGVHFYTLDLQTMKQVNDNTGGEREIRRMPCDNQ